MVDEDLGQATLVYEGPDGDTIEEHVENEHLAYFQDHWIVKTNGEDEGGETEAGETSETEESDFGEGGHDTVRRIPAPRVYYVERDVEAFEEEVSSVLDDVQSVADGLEQELRTVKSRIRSAAGEVQGGLLGSRRHEGEEADEVHRIQVDTGESVDEEPGDAHQE